MSALYVDLDADGIQSPRNIEPGVARQMVDLAEEAIGHARQNLGMLTAEILPHLARLAPVIDRALERVVDESQPVSALSLLRRLLHAGQSDDISAIVAMLGPETDEQDSSPGNSGLPGGRSART